MTPDHIGELALIEVSRWQRQSLEQTTMTPQIGTYIRIAFGAKASQVAIVRGVCRDGRLQVQAYNKAQGKWMPGIRRIAAGEIMNVYDARPIDTPAATALKAPTKRVTVNEIFNNPRGWMNR